MAPPGVLNQLENEAVIDTLLEYQDVFIGPNGAVERISPMGKSGKE